MPTIENLKRPLNSGYTLIEVLAAFTIFTVATGPALWIVTNVGNTAISIQNDLVAANLAQEGLEVIRAMRDTAWLEGQISFDSNICVLPCGIGESRVVRVEYNSERPLSLDGNPRLKLNESTGIYNYNTGEDTIFSRQITVTGVGNDELKIVSRIDWNERGTDKNIALESHLFNWMQ